MSRYTQYNGTKLRVRHHQCNCLAGYSQALDAALLARYLKYIRFTKMLSLLRIFRGSRLFRYSYRLEDMRSAPLNYQLFIKINFGILLGKFSFIFRNLATSPLTRPSQLRVLSVSSCASYSFAM